MESAHIIDGSSSRAVRARPRLSRRVGFWAVAFSFLVVAAFSTAPSSLYGLYEQGIHASSLTITFVYGVYAVGVIAALILFGHVSDQYGRRAVMFPAVCTMIAAACVFLLWRSIPGLFLARVLTGLGLGATVATATAFITDLDVSSSVGQSRRAGTVATVANIGGLASGPLIAGVLARYEPKPLMLPFEVLLGLLVLAAICIAVAPEGHPPDHPLPPYRPQRLSIPKSARRRFAAAAVGVFMCFAAFGLFAGLAGAFLAGPLNHPSPALCGLTIFVTFGAGVVVQVSTMHWPSHRLFAAGIVPTLIGLGVVVLSAWTSPPSLALFIIGGVVVGAGGGAIFRGSVTVAISASDSHDRASVLAAFFTSGFLGLSLPVVGLGIALQHISPRVTLLIFGILVAAGTLAAAPILTRPLNAS